MKTLFKVLACMAVALGLGLGSAVWAVRSQTDRSGVVNGPWRTTLTAGSREAGWYTRALVARAGLFALDRKETIYYVAGQDESGEPLRGDQSYRLEGRDPGARWWSLTLYGPDYFLAPNPMGRYSIGKFNVSRRQDGTLFIPVSADPSKENGLPTGGVKTFYLTLRLYNPDPVYLDHPDTAPLFRIIREERP